MEREKITAERAMNAAGLLRGELFLTVNIIAGLAIGELILSSGVVETVFAPLIPRLERWGIHGNIAAAMLIALGSSRSGAAIISASYSDGEISHEEATYGTLSLAFPGYLRRWVGTAAVATAIAGTAGLIFAIVMIARSAVRFVWVVAMLAKRGKGARGGSVPRRAPRPSSAGFAARRDRVVRTLKRSLPWAWAFFALTFALVPLVDKIFADHIVKWGLHWILPPQGWAVAASSLAHITAALSSAGGALAGGELGVGQAVLALLIGNMVGSITRVMRQNVGYWVGIFPKDIVPRLLRWHLATTVTLEVASIALAWFLCGVNFLG
jgi:hypothetical protein